jgi:hypothetical protein
MSELLVVGVSHKTAPVELRERLALLDGRAREFLRVLERRRAFGVEAQPEARQRRLDHRQRLRRAAAAGVRIDDQGDRTIHGGDTVPWRAPCGSTT